MKKLLIGIILLFAFCNSVNAVTIFYDDFSDGNLSDWDTNTGAWNALTFQALGGGLDGSTLSHSVSTLGGSDYTISYKNNPNSVGLSNSFAWFTDQNGSSNFTGYRTIIRTDGFQLQRANGSGSFTTLLSNSFPISAGVDHNITIFHKIDGNISVFLDNNSQGSIIDTTYTSGTKIFLSTTNTDANGIFDDINISAVGTKAVTILRPIDEKTNNTIYKPWTVSLTGASIQYIDNNSNSKVLFLPDTNNVASFLVDDSNQTNDEYYARNYVVYIDNNSSVTIQPYLISVNDGILVNLKVADISTNQTLPNIRIQMYAGVNQTNTVVEDRLTDSAGVAQFIMLAQKVYQLNVTSPNLDTNYFSGLQNLTASSQTFTIWINYSTSSIVINQDNTSITIFPTTTAIINNPQRIDVNVDTNAPHDFIYVQAYDSNTLVDQNNCSSSPCHVALTLNFNNFDTNFLNIKVIIQNEDFNFTRTISYYTAPFLNSIVTRVQNLKNEIGPVTLGVIMFAVIFGLIAFLGSNGLGNNMSQIFLIVITAGVFYFLWFYDVTKLFGGELFVAFLAGLLGVMLIYFWARQKGGP